MGAGILALVLGAVAVAPVATDNALTLPAQRHLVRMAPGGGNAVWLLALQQLGAQGRGLSFYRSDDEARTWRFYAPIQPDWSHADRADLVPVGDDVALVYSWEDAHLSPSVRHDVFFQWWRWAPASREYVPEPAVRVFDSTSSSTGYYRAELARDSLGRLWVQAFRREADGVTHTAVLSVSEDGGRTFRVQSPLAQLKGERAGGRILGIGRKVVFIYDSYAASSPGRMRIRSDSDALSRWEPEVTALPDGLYHGAALSAAPTGDGGMHLVYKDKAEQLYYRRFDGTAFGPRQLLLANGDWVLQPAITRLGDRLVVFYNRNLRLDLHYELYATVLDGGAFSSPTLLDGSVSFKGYPASAEVLPATTPDVPCFYSSASNSSVAGSATLAFHSPGGPAAPALTLLRPNGGEALPAGASFNVEWAASGAIAQVTLEASLDDGATWSPIATALANTGSYAWNVPATETAAARVRVSDASNPAVSDASDAPFRIGAAPAKSLALLQPQGGDALLAGAPFELRWQTRGEIPLVHLDYSSDAGLRWTRFATALPNTGRYAATAPLATTASARVRVSDAADPSVSSTSGTFQITPRRLTLLAPNGGETLPAGAASAVRWSTTGFVPLVSLAFSLDDGATWTAIASSINNSGSFAWSVPAVASQSARVRVFDSSTPAVADSSDAAFTIAAPGASLRLRQPNGGEALPAGSTFPIQWETTGAVAQVDLAYSTDSGATWMEIARGVANTGGYLWTLPGSATAAARVRVGSAADPALFDTSDGSFAITVPEERRLTLLRPNGGEALVAGRAFEIQWSWSGAIPEVDLDFSSDDGLRWTRFATRVANTGRYLALVPSLSTARARVRVSSASDLEVSDASDRSFTITLSPLAP